MSIDVTFKRGIAEWQDMCHGLMVEKGFWDKERNVPEMLALIHSEVSEALEAHRRSNYIGFAEELADIVYRVLDMAGGLGVDLEQELENKHDKNCLRPYKHGKNY
jgi:NTP pyrophosphatase (non-canonical NTP hydrolase)